MPGENNIQSLTKEALEVRRQVLDMIVSAHASHIASAYSCTDLLVYLYDRALRIDPKNPLDPDRDRFILSKGWGVSALYTVLARKGFFPVKDLKNYCKDGSHLIGIATRNHVPGIEATTGSMGHGLPIGVGMAKALKLQKRNSRVFVVVSDGEHDEGSTWEAVLQAGHHKLDNLVAIVDYNKWQSFGSVKSILDLEPLRAKWEAFNWSAVEINGHNFADMDRVFSRLPLTVGKPSVIIAHTVKGKGVSVLEDRNEWHYRTPTAAEIEVAKKELAIP